MSVTPRPVKCCLAALVLLSSCAADATVVIQLVGLGTEDPYAGVTSIEVTASVNEKIISRERTAFDGQPIALDPLEPKNNMVLRATGFDDSDAMLARGLARPRIPGDGEPCCVLMCFCTTPVFEDGDCSCGSDACVAECFE